MIVLAYPIEGGDDRVRSRVKVIEGKVGRKNREGKEGRGESLTSALVFMTSETTTSNSVPVD